MQGSQACPIEPGYGLESQDRCGKGTSAARTAIGPYVGKLQLPGGRSTRLRLAVENGCSERSKCIDAVVGQSETHCTTSTSHLKYHCITGPSHFKKVWHFSNSFWTYRYGDCQL